MTTAFVLSGGGSLGAVQVGMLQALGERGVVPDLLVGTSAGAINAAFVGGHGMGAAALLELAGLWRSLRRRDVFALRPLHGVLAVAGVRPSLFSAEPLRRLVGANLGYRDLLDAGVELHLVTTDLSSGQEVMLSSGDAASAVVASAAIPGVFPPVCRAGRLLVDGGIAEHTAIRHAIDRGADEVYLLPTGFPCALVAAPTTAVGVALQALTLLSQQQLIGEVARYSRTRQAQGAATAVPTEGLRRGLQPRRRADRQGQEGHGVVDRCRRPRPAHATTVSVNARPQETKSHCAAGSRSGQRAANGFVTPLTAGGYRSSFIVAALVLGTAACCRSPSVTAGILGSEPAHREGMTMFTLCGPCDSDHRSTHDGRPFDTGPRRHRQRGREDSGFSPRARRPGRDRPADSRGTAQDETPVWRKPLCTQSQRFDENAIASYRARLQSTALTYGSNFRMYLAHRRRLV